MKPYLDLICHVLDHGARNSDRTGTGTLSVFGHQMRYDLGAGFPVLTTKKLHLKSIIHDLLWLLQDSTNIAYLKQSGVGIRYEWADNSCEFGSINVISDTPAQSNTRGSICQFHTKSRR